MHWHHPPPPLLASTNYTPTVEQQQQQETAAAAEEGLIDDDDIDADEYLDSAVVRGVAGHLSSLEGGGWAVGVRRVCAVGVQCVARGVSIVYCIVY